MTRGKLRVGAHSEQLTLEHVKVGMPVSTTACAPDEDDGVDGISSYFDFTPPEMSFRMTLRQ